MDAPDRRALSLPSPSLHSPDAQERLNPVVRFPCRQEGGADRSRLLVAGLYAPPDEREVRGRSRLEGLAITVRQWGFRPRGLVINGCHARALTAGVLADRFREPLAATACPLNRNATRARPAVGGDSAGLGPTEHAQRLPHQRQDDQGANEHLLNDIGGCGLYSKTKHRKGPRDRDKRRSRACSILPDPRSLREQDETRPLKRAVGCGSVPVRDAGPDSNRPCESCLSSLALTSARAARELHFQKLRI